MSIPVDVADLATTLHDFGDGFLLSTADGRVKVVAVAPGLADGVLHVRTPGRGSLANVAANPSVTLLYPPRELRGFSLLVDGTAVVEGDDVLVTPTGAVLHKPAPLP